MLRSEPNWPCNVCASVFYFIFYCYTCDWPINVFLSFFLSFLSLQQKIFRTSPQLPIKTYTLNTITYGTASAPYLATKCLVSLAESTNNSRVKESIRRDFYVDDYLVAVIQ
jgi:hypothetical protein